MIEDLPLLTIRCITYNHEPYIAQCLEGFIMQQTNFKFEAIVHDDASTDRTADIIREYAKKYPDIIKPIYETENQYSKRDGSLGRIMNSHMRGKYIAICEGDDYWTEPLKLQKQVDFLENHPEFSVTSHRFKIFDQEENVWKNDGWDRYFKKNKDGIVYDHKFVYQKLWISKTLSLVFRRECMNEYIFSDTPKGDTILVFFLLKHGNGYSFNKEWGVYRLHMGGVCTMLKQIVRDEKAYCDWKRMFEYENSSFTRNLYYSKYATYFVATKGRLLFQEKFSFPKFLSLFYDIPYKLIKKLFREFNENRLFV